MLEAFNGYVCSFVKYFCLVYWVLRTASFPACNILLIVFQYYSFIICFLEKNYMGKYTYIVESGGKERLEERLGS